MTTYTWTDNVMRSGSNCDVDKVADNLMNLKYEASTVIPLGTIASGTITLTKDRFHSVTFSGAAKIALPTGLTSGMLVNCALFLKLGSVVTITMPANVTWAYGVAPPLTSTTATYRITFETIDGGTSWYGYYTQIGT